MSLRYLARVQTWTFNRPAVSYRDGLPREGSASGLVNATLSASTREITAGLRRGRPGTRLKLALRLYTEDQAVAIKRGDRATGTWPYPGPGGQTVNLLVAEVRPYQRRREIDLVDVIDETGSGV